jgi:phosphatidylserine/phosphatidylglycerophosphate/cardiolipin synthase-like enzyme
VKFHPWLAVALAVCALGVPAYADARSLKSDILDLVEQTIQPGATRVPATGEVEYAFSPHEGAERLVLKVIGSARSELRVLAYSFTSAPVTAALIAARKRGVDVRVVVDHRSNAGQDRSGKAKAALNAMSLAGIAVRTTSAYAIHHDKVVIADQTTTQTGSFNFSAAAAKSNSENVIVLWNNPGVAHGYLRHWDRNWRQGAEWRPAF